MKKLQSIFFIFAIFALPFLGCSERRETGIAPGPFAPDFSLQLFDNSGKNGVSADPKKKGAKLTLVHFWATWCGPCQEELPLLESMYKKYHAAGLEIFAIASEDDPEKVKETVLQMGLTFPVLLDPKGAVRDLYKVAGFPETVFLNESGKFVMLFDPETNSPQIRVTGARAWNAIDLKSHLK